MMNLYSTSAVDTTIKFPCANYAIVYHITGNCDFLFQQQPLAELSCNPWPYVHTDNDSLTLQCSINGPQSQDIPHATWYMSGINTSTAVGTKIFFNKAKYLDPTYSADIGGGRKMVDFMLVITSVNEEDAGCYWCGIDVVSPECNFPLIRSSAFCLYEETYYTDMDNCTTIPTNDTVVCAGNQSDCGTIIPSTGAVEPTEFPLPSQTSHLQVAFLL